ncbi:hypothetical protein PGRAN_11243 [Listeria grandensis FSL F6-0971]|uniref:HTH cro/C1-type domain-containing protein n=1 Tax=Listeria grandensis FSL F6-0971 TaxID=1265819 RepID=W7BIA6_9LIST|nr:helix-turn-helix transcriptional regulator [Listeria grandensis]EUJ22966.1 hypothetical protein PGRAN_11243 [Listeria grandensis FSL F6-0971]
MNNAMREVRRSKKLSLLCISIKTGLPEGYLSQIERSIRSVDSEKAKLIAAALEVAPEQIFLPKRFTVRSVQ